MHRAVVFIGLVLLSVSVVAVEREAYPRPDLLVEGAELAKRTAGKQAVVLDARSRKAYETEHVLGAVWVDCDEWKSAFKEGKDAPGWSKRIGALGIGAESRVVVYDDKDSNDAARIWWILRYWSVADVRLLNGGWQGWKSAGLPTAREVPAPPAPSRFEAKPRSTMLATKQQILDALKAGPRQIVDARSEGEFCGIEKKQNKRGGAIPGAKHLDWSDLIDKASHRFKGREELRRLLAEAGIELGRPSTTYCQSGGRASVMAFAMELMGANEVRNYYQSWQEWGNADDTPIATSRTGASGDQPQWGQRWTRNLVSDEKGLPEDFDPGQKDVRTGEIDLKSTRNVKWVARLGNQSYGTPIVAGGKVFVGTNNDAPRDPRMEGDRGVLMCFDEATGRYLWQLNLPKLLAIKWADWRYIGITSTPVVEGNRAYVVTNRNEVLCLDSEGMANGNDGPFVDEGKLMAAEDQKPLVPGKQDADVLWMFDMTGVLKAEPHNAATSSVLIDGDYLYVCTANGVEWTHAFVVHPEAPSVIVLDKRTGRLVAQDDFRIGPDVTHGQWSSLSMGQVAGRKQFYFAAGNGVLYAFEEPAAPATGKEPALLKNIWRFNGHPAAQTEEKVTPDHKHDSTSFQVTGNPVFYKNRVYTIFTQEPFHKMKLGRLTCVDATKTGDVTRRGGLVWAYDAIGSSSSTVAIHDGLVYATGFDGRLHCVDAQTGKPYWVHDAGNPIWASPLVADGKLYLGTGKSTFWILAAGKELNVIRKIRMTDIVHTTPTVANGVLYVATYKHLYAIRQEGK